MRRRGVSIVIAGALCLQLAHARPVERAVLVPDEATAIAIAKAVLVPIFGADFESGRRRATSGGLHTFYAVRSGERWVVEDAPPARKKWADPVLRVEIDRKRGCVSRISEY